MVESRWGRRLGPGIAALVGSSASRRRRSVRRPTGHDGAAAGLPGDRGDSGSAASTGAPWFRLEPTLVDGARRGQRLDVGRGRGRRRGPGTSTRSRSRAGPIGGRVVVGTDDGRRSTVSVSTRRAGCAVAGRDVDRCHPPRDRAPDGSTLYEFRVRRADRADLGVWRRIPGAATAERVFGRSPPDAAFGRTWLTELALGGPTAVDSW